jgi:Polysaccharide deacetylase
MRRVKIAVLIVLRALGLFALARIITKDRLRILCYHGGQIGDEGRYNPLLFGSAKLVDQRLRWLRDRGFAPVAIDVLDHSVEELRVRRKSFNLPVLVTLDDGWFSSVESIVDVCHRHGFPVCMYLATKPVGNGLPIVPVVVGYLLWCRRKSQLLLDPEGVSESGPRGRYDLDEIGDRTRFLRQAIEWIESLPEDRAAVVGAMELCASWLGISSAELNLESRRFDYLTPQEIRALASPRFSFEIHGHVHHYPLGQADSLFADIEACKQSLREFGIGNARHYCYPSGAFDDHARSVLSKAEVRSGTTCFPGLVDFRRIGSLIYLPRFLDGENVFQIEFEAEMSGVMDIIRDMASGLGLKRRPSLVGT